MNREQQVGATPDHASSGSEKNREKRNGKDIGPTGTTARIVVGFVGRCSMANCRCFTRPPARDTRGVIKMVLGHPTRRVAGVSMLGVNVDEVIHEAAMALRFGATTNDFIDLIHVYPTMAEALKLVAISFTKDVNRLSCCAN